VGVTLAGRGESELSMGDGRAMPFEGWALVALYVVLATLVWFE
jgi:hypothetical protein